MARRAERRTIPRQQVALLVCRPDRLFDRQRRINRPGLQRRRRPANLYGNRARRRGRIAGLARSRRPALFGLDRHASVARRRRPRFRDSAFRRRPLLFSDVGLWPSLDAEECRGRLQGRHSHIQRRGPGRSVRQREDSRRPGEGRRRGVEARQDRERYRLSSQESGAGRRESSDRPGRISRRQHLDVAGRTGKTARSAERLVRRLPDSMGFDDPPGELRRAGACDLHANLYPRPVVAHELAGEAYHEEEFPDEIETEDRLPIKRGKFTQKKETAKKHASFDSEGLRRIREALRDISFRLPGLSFKSYVRGDAVWILMVRANQGTQETVSSAKAKLSILDDAMRMERTAFRERRS